MIGDALMRPREPSEAEVSETSGLRAGVNWGVVRLGVAQKPRGIRRRRDAEAAQQDGTE